MSNVERQRLFRLRNPGYYARIHARKRAGARAAVAQQVAAAQAAAAVAVRREPSPLPPEPVERPGIPGINAIPAAMPEQTAAAVS